MSAAVALAFFVLAAMPAHAASGGLEIFPDRYIVVPLIVMFALLIVPVNRLLYVPLLRVLDERRERIEGARARSESIAKEADDVLARYEAALRGARDDAESERRGRVESARNEQVRVAADARASAERELSTARAEVERALGDARSQLREQAELLAREAASRVLGRSLS